jgi:hypothetical protein
MWTLWRQKFKILLKPLVKRTPYFRMAIRGLKSEMKPSIQPMQFMLVKAKKTIDKINSD